MNHTPGPWKLITEEDYARTHGRVYIAMPPDYRWFFEDCYVDKEQAEIDGRLMAAAPELLEALKVTIIALETISNYLPFGQIANAILENARETVAKAKGD